MTELIGNVTDFARGRLGGGLRITRSTDRALLEAELRQVTAELGASWPDRDIQAAIGLTREVSVDVSRMGQLLSNLLANALTHGDPRRPVRVDVTTHDRQFVVSVMNSGVPLSKDALGRLFQPFVRGIGHSEREGLGLELHIVGEIARAHGGAIEVESNDDRTVFSFRLPLP